MVETLNEFHVSKKIRDLCNFDKSIYSSSGNVIIQDFKAIQQFQTLLNQVFESRDENEKKISAGSLNAMGLIDEIFHYLCALYRKQKNPECFKNLLADLDKYLGEDTTNKLLLEFIEEFPPTDVYQNKISAEEYLNQTCFETFTKTERSNREQILEEFIMLHLENENPAFHQFAIMFDDSKLALNPDYTKVWNRIKAFFMTQATFGPKSNNLIAMFKEPVISSPTSLKGQLNYIRENWGYLIEDFLNRLLEGIGTISEEEKAMWNPPAGGFDMDALSYENLMKEYERFSPDREWMPKVVLMAKTVLVWLYQLRKKYNADIYRLDQIPDEELDNLRDQGFTGLWLIGLWERSYASKRIKQINGNPEAAASAYSLWDYEIAGNLGGWEALENLRYRCWMRGIRLASDMVPNHTGMDGKWVTEHPNYFITTKECPFPQYSFSGENLSQNPDISLYLEDHYYSKSDCAVCYMRVDNRTGDVTYIYHGNDGTGLPWNDTAQIDFLNSEAREAVMQQILKVARNFPIIRFDAAMVLAKKHIRRLWYPEPGHGGDIASRSRYSLSTQQFEDAIPNEFWREVVDRCAQEMPDTLLLAEAFWMMEGYFTRTLGMHRVYNSAFMNMLKKEENQKYRDTVKNTIKFDPQVLKRFVNFMNNPDEETAVAQFGKGDKYFGVCTLMSTMPGLPMFGHGQIEGFEEKYGMEYTRAYKDENPDENLVNRHNHDIFPLLHKRYLFAGVENFLFYDVWNDGYVNENVFAYSNRAGNEGTIVFYNNKYERAAGWIKQSCEYAVKIGSGEKDVKMETRSLAEGIGLTSGKDNYCIFKEHKSGLWYVRKCDDIINNGMFVSLNGFESQVYLDIHQVEDTEDKKYSKLNEILNGSGTPDLEVAWQEYQYKELYEALSNFLNEEYFEAVKSLFPQISNHTDADFKEITLDEFFDSVKENALAYFEKEQEFSEKEKGDFVTKKKGERIYSQKDHRIKDKSITASSEQRYAAFCKQIEYIYNTVLGAQGLDSTETKQNSSRTRSNSNLIMNFDNTVFNGLLSNKNAIELICAFAAVNSCGYENCLKFGYNRKIAEYFHKAQVYIPNAKDILQRIFVCMKIRDLNFGTASIIKSTHTVAKLLVESEYAGLLSGAHEFDNISWFNKERIEETMWYMLVTVAMCNNRVMRDQIYRLYKSLMAATVSSNYKSADFVESIKPAKKATTKKTTSTRTKKTSTKL